MRASRSLAPSSPDHGRRRAPTWSTPPSGAPSLLSPKTYRASPTTPRFAVSALCSNQPAAPKATRSIGRERGIAFQGCIVLGMGFVLEHTEAQEWIANDPHNTEVSSPTSTVKTSTPDPTPPRPAGSSTSTIAPKPRARYIPAIPTVQRLFDRNGSGESQPQIVLRRPLPQRGGSTRRNAQRCAGRSPTCRGARHRIGQQDRHADAGSFWPCVQPRAGECRHYAYSGQFLSSSLTRSGQSRTAQE